MPAIRTPWRAVAAAFALNGVLLGAWASRIPAMVERHGLSESGLGLLLLAMGTGALISFPAAGRLADSLGSARVSKWIALVYLGTIVLVGLAPSPLWLGGALFLFGMCHGSMDVTMNSWATEVEKHMDRAVMSSFHAMWSIGAGLGAATGFAAAATGLSPAAHFTLAAIGAAALFGPLVLIAWQSPVRPRASGEPAFVLPRGGLILVGVFALSAGLGEGAVADWSAVFLRDTVGTGEAQATLGYTVFSAAMVAMRLCADRLVIRLGPVRVARASALTAALGVALVTGFATLPAALAGYGLMGLGYAALIPLAFSRAARDPGLPPGQAIASVATLSYGAMLLGPPAIGLIAEASSLRLAFVMLGGFALLAAVLAPVLQGGQRPAAAPAE